MKTIFNERGLESVAKFVRGLEQDEGISYYNALGRYMISADLYFSDADYDAIKETYERLFPEEVK